MVFNDTTNLSGIIQSCERLCKLGNGAISGDTTLLKQFTALSNEAFNEVWMAQLDVDKNIRSDDYNYTNVPDAPITMVLNQADYTLPVAVTGYDVATFLRLKGVYFIKDGVRTYLSPMDEGDTLTSTAGTPIKYQLNGKSIVFQCPVDATTLTQYSSTFHIEFQRLFEAFISTDTTKQPGIMSTYHDLIPLRASAKYLIAVNPQLATLYDNQFTARLRQFQNDVANIDDASPRRMSVGYQNNK